MKLIGTIVANGSTQEINFTNIPSSFTDIVAIGSIRSLNSFSTGQIYWWVNDIRTTYKWLNLYSNGSGLGSNISSSSDSQMNAYNIMPGSSSTSNTFNNFTLHIPNYGSSLNKVFSIDAVAENNSSASGLNIGVGLLSNTAAITKLTIGVDTTNMASGSMVSLYGITKGSGLATVS